MITPNPVNLELLEPVLATVPGHQALVQVRTNLKVPVQVRNRHVTRPLCLGGVVTWTGHIPAVFWPG